MAEPQLPLDWDERISGLPGAHILQTAEWARVKQPLGWKPLPLEWRGGSGELQGAGLVLERSLGMGRLALPLRVQYAPRGPLLDWRDARLRQRVLDDLEAQARRRGAIVLKIDPEVFLGTGVPGEAGACDDPLGAEVTAELERRGWRFSPDQIQYRNSVWVDLRPDEETLLGRMKPKARYNIRLAERKGVQVRRAGPDDLPGLYRMYAETSVRDGFVIRGEAYYLNVWRTFLQADLGEALVAEVEGQAVAGVVILRFAGSAWYLYGMSRDLHREKMPNVLLQWEAMRRAKQAGCTRYDLWGAPNEFTEADPMWGVFRFKQGLGGEVVRTLGAWDYAPQPGLYRLYTRTLPRLLDLMRRRGRERTRLEVGPG